MKHHLGIGMSLEACSLGVVDGEGRIVRESKVASEPEAILAWRKAAELAPERVGLGAGPLLHWLLSSGQIRSEPAGRTIWAG